MYTMTADDKVFFSPDLVEDGLVVESPYYESEVNKAGSCQFYIYNNNPFYNNLKPLKTIISIKDDGEEVWRGRVLNVIKNINNRKTVYCEGLFSIFVDTIVRPYEHTKNLIEQFTYLITNHNSQVEEFKQFTVGTVDVEDLYGSKKWTNTSYSQTKDAIDDLITSYGGYIVIEHTNSSNIIHYKKDPGVQSNQVIEFGENLLDVTDTTNPENVFTILIPIGYDSEGNRITIESVNQGKDYIESAEGISLYGKIVNYFTFQEDIATASELLSKGTEYLNKNIKAARTISIKAIDKHVIDKTLRRINVYDLVEVHSTVNDIHEVEMCSKIKIDMEDLSQSEYTIGTVPDGITNILGNTTSTTNRITGNSSPAIPSGDETRY